MTMNAKELRRLERKAEKAVESLRDPELREIAKQARHAIVIARQRGQCLDEPYATLIDDLTAALAAAQPQEAAERPT